MIGKRNLPGTHGLDSIIVGYYKEDRPAAGDARGRASLCVRINDISLRISALEKTTRIINGEPVCFWWQDRAGPCGSNREI
jgi:hypothetical protein